MKKKRKKNNKIKKKIILISSIFIIFLFLLITPILTLFNFFEDDESKVIMDENYVSNNYPYSKDYISVVNKNIRDGNGYVTLSRVLYFLLEDNKLTYDEVYTDNLSIERKQEKPISEVCKMDKYKKYSVCNSESIAESGQNDSYEEKPFGKPINFTSMNVSSFFMQNRKIGVSSVHKAWDFSAPEGTPVYSVCNGTVEDVTFPYQTNVKNMSDKGGGNRIKINCNYGSKTYSVFYMHLYPNSYLVKKGQVVSKGDLIAGVGTTGMSTGNHLHFQVNLNGKEIDGMKLIGFK